jgi:hypothetical protein
VSEEANEHGQQEEASPSKTPLPPPKFEPDTDLIIEEQRTGVGRRDGLILAPGTVTRRREDSPEGSE